MQRSSKAVQEVQQSYVQPSQVVPVQQGYTQQVSNVQFAPQNMNLVGSVSPSSPYASQYVNPQQFRPPQVPQRF